MKTYFIFLLLNLSLLTGIFCQPYLEWESRFTGVNLVDNETYVNINETYSNEGREVDIFSLI